MTIVRDTLSTLDGKQNCFKKTMLTVGFELSNFVFPRNLPIRRSKHQQESLGAIKTDKLQKKHHNPRKQDTTT